jgi:class 3 adenylate cyclase/predicted ATPase
VATGPARELRKTVTVLFCDVVHSTALTEDVDPESLRRVMSRYFEVMRAAVERHGGTVEKFSGDEVMAVFGVPVVHEDDPVRAVRAAAEMHERLEELNEELERTWGIRLQIRIGINTGQVVAGDPSSGQTFVTGEPVVLAKRLEQAAAPGDILIGKATYPLVKDAVTVGPRERFPAKGKREQAERRRVDAVDRRAPGLARRLDIPMVGRTDELSLLRHAFDRAVAERGCRLFTILGAAGIGKSRLAAELITSVADRATSVTGRCLPYGEGITFWPLTEIVRDLGGEDGIRTALAVEDDGKLVVELIRGAVGASTEARTSDETFWAIRRLFETLARERPLIVCVEDIHWAEPTFLDLIEYVVGWSRDAPILVLCLARPDVVEERPTWVTPRANADTLSLDPLSTPDVGALLQCLHAETGLTGDERQRIAEAAEGNPLFIEQMAALAGESNGDGELSIPPSIHALLAERLDRLAGPERSIIERAAVIGRDFSAQAVVELTPAGERDAVATHLLALVRKQLFRPDTSRSSREDRFRFQHVLIRDAAYDAMPKGLRADLNERVADWLESDGAGVELEELVGYHLEQAYRFRVQIGPVDESARLLARRASDRLASAGRRTLTRGDARAAASLLQRAATLSEASPERRSALLPDLGAALREAGDLAASDDVLSEAIAVAQGAHDRGAEARATIERAFTRRHRSEGLEHARDVAETILPVLIELGDDAGISKALTLSGQTAYVRCHVSEAETLLERALVHAERVQDPQQPRRVLTLLAKTNLDGPRPAEEAIERLAELGRRLHGDRTLDAVIALQRAPLEAMRGRASEARDLYRHAQAALEELGRSLAVANARFDSGAVELLVGDATAAERELRSGFDALRSFGETGVLSSVAALLGQAVLLQGRAEEAERYAAVSEEMSSEEDVFSQVEWRTLRATLAVRAGLLDEAEGHGREAVELTRETDVLNLQGDALAALAEALEASGQLSESRDRYMQAQGLYERKGNIVLAGRIAARLTARQPS